MKTFIKDQHATGTFIGFTELIARAISVHILSCRQAGLFIPLNL
jgi:hypothetical protein